MLKDSNQRSLLPEATNYTQQSQKSHKQREVHELTLKFVWVHTAKLEESFVPTYALCHLVNQWVN